MSALRSSDTTAALFELHCWGEFELRDLQRGGGCTPRGRKARAIIAYLAAQGAPVGRERLAGLLWSERGDEQARASLRQTLSELRLHASGVPSLLVIGRDQLRLDSTVLITDVARMEALARDGDLAGLTETLREKGDRFYDGLDGLDPAFDDWLALERQRQFDRLFATSASAAARGLERGAFNAVAHLATVLQALDETNETVARIAMQADRARGDHGSVHRRYRRLQDAMRQQLNAAPSPETRALFVDLTERELAPATGIPNGPIPQRSSRTPPVIAVLPFESRSNDEKDARFAERLADDLTVALSRSPWVNVLAASVIRARCSQASDLSQLRRELGARYLLISAES